MNRINKIEKLIPYFLCLLLVIFQVILLNYDSNSGREYEKISIKLDSLEMDNSILDAEVASSSSLIAVSEKAKSLGFSSKKSVISLYGREPLAALSNTL